MNNNLFEIIYFINSLHKTNVVLYLKELKRTQALKDNECKIIDFNYLIKLKELLIFPSVLLTWAVTSDDFSRYAHTTSASGRRSTAAE